MTNTATATKATPTKARAAAYVAPLDTATVADTADTAEAPTADAFRAALAAASVAGDTAGAATATLAAIALARYTVHAQRYITLQGETPILPESDRKNVAALVWLEATGSITAPSAADRTPGETSLGQYVSRMGTVATNLDYGMDYLTGVDSLTAAYTQIGADSKASKDAKADRAFIVFAGTLSESERAAFDYVTATMRGFGSEHRAAFVRSITPNTK